MDNGAAAVEALRLGKYDLILMDWQMPIMSGAEATGRIRNSSHSHAPIIAVTAHAMDGDREKCILAGASDYLAKPGSVTGSGKSQHLSQDVHGQAPMAIAQLLA